MPGEPIYTDKPNIWEAEAEGSGVKDHPWLRGQSVPILDYLRPCLKTIKQSNKGTNKIAKETLLAFPWGFCEDGGIEEP